MEVKTRICSYNGKPINYFEGTLTEMKKMAEQEQKRSEADPVSPKAPITIKHEPKSIFEHSSTDSSNLPTFGFKIHLSATINNYRDLSKLVFPFLDERNIAYKYIARDEDIWHNFSTGETLAESGKYITIYPENKETFLELLEELYQLIPQEFEGIYILSDRPYKDSKVIFYRYGTIKWDISTIKNGFPTIIGANQEEWQDYQKPYFDLPAWIEDIQPDNIIKESYLASHYQVSEILRQSNGGNIYRGTLLDSGQAVVLKETRPHVLSFEDIHQSDFKQAEFEMIQNLSSYVPRPIEKVKEWINTYYIYQAISGQDFYMYAKDYGIFGCESKQTSDYIDNLAKFRVFISLTRKLLEMVKYFHDRNIILHDIHPNNILVDDSENLHFVDLEHAYHYQVGRPLSGVYHDVALKKWNQLDGKVADCHKVGNMLLYTLGKLHIKEKLTVECHIATDLLRNYGIDTDFTKVIDYLFSEEVSISGALELLDKVSLKSIQPIEPIILIPNQLSANPTTFRNHVATICPVLIEFRHAISQENYDYFKYLVDREKQLGLDGLLGQIFLLQEEGLPKEWFHYGLDKVISQLYHKGDEAFVPIGQGRLSPYFNNGNAGLIQFLLQLDKERYQELILSLGRGLDFEIAQFIRYHDGILGIADTLLKLHAYQANPDYLYYARKLLQNSYVYLKHGKLTDDEFYPIWQRLLEVSP